MVDGLAANGLVDGKSILIRKFAASKQVKLESYARCRTRVKARLRPLLGVAQKGATTVRLSAWNSDTLGRECSRIPRLPSAAISRA